MPTSYRYLAQFIALTTLLVSALSCSSDTASTLLDKNEPQAGRSHETPDRTSSLSELEITDNLSSPIHRSESSFTQPNESSISQHTAQESSASHTQSTHSNTTPSSEALTISSSSATIHTYPAVDPTSDKLANITKKCTSTPSKISAGESGWNSRYWDCCKPHCSVQQNTDNWSKNCSIEDEELPCFFEIGDEYWSGFDNTKTGCQAGGEAFACYSHAPYAVCENLAYGYAAVPGIQEDMCGSCFQLDYDGGFEHGEPKATHKLMAGKTMIVMASNIGHDVASGQFDIMIPGGGLGAFDAGCAVQWNVDPNDEQLVGKKFGGLTSTCQEKHGWDESPEVYKECVREMCDNLFGQEPSMRDLWEGCIWYVDWMHAVDNPTFTYTQVECPQELIDGYGSSFH